MAHNGRFGPYLKRGTDTRSLTDEEQLLTVTLDEALAVFAQPKTRRGRASRRPAPRARRRSRHRAAGGPPRGPVRAVRDRRHHQRLAAQGRRPRDGHHRAGGRAAGRAPGRRAVHPAAGRRRPRRPRPRSAAKKAPAKKAAKKTAGQEGPGQEGGGPRGRRRDRRRGTDGGVTPTAPGPPDRPRGDRRLRQVDPGPGPGRALGARAHPRAGGHRRSAGRCAALLLDPDRPARCRRAEALLMAADRAQHVDEVIRPALAEGRWVVTDRFSGSTLAYQGWGRGLATEPLRQVVGWAAGGVAADLSVLVDVPVEVARQPARRERAGPARAPGPRRSTSASATGSSPWRRADPGAGRWSTATDDADAWPGWSASPWPSAVGRAPGATPVSGGDRVRRRDDLPGGLPSSPRWSASPRRWRPCGRPPAHPVHAYLFCGPAGLRDAGRRPGPSPPPCCAPTAAAGRATPAGGPWPVPTRTS